MQDDYTTSDYTTENYTTDESASDYSSSTDVPSYDSGAFDSSYGSTTYEPTAPIDAGVGLALAGGVMLFVFILCIALYIYFSLALMKIAQKSNTENAWFAWIPILSTILIIQIAKKPIWWILLMLIPFVNIVITILVWMEVAKAVGKQDWLGILMLVPIANIIIPGYLAWSKSDTPTYQEPVAPSTPQAPAMPQ